MSIRLYVGNLPKEVIDRDAFQQVFAESEISVTTKLIKDRKTGKCRGFGFVSVANEEEVDKFIEKYNGSVFKDNPLKIEKALPRNKAKGDEKEEKNGKPITKSSSNSGPNTGNKKKKNRRQKGNNKYSSGGFNKNNDSIQPDPRWASELAKLKEMLASQTTN